MLDAFELEVAATPRQLPRRRVLSNVSGGLLGSEVLDAGYWRRQARGTVNFERMMHVVREQGCEVMVEVGPHPVLLGMGAACWPEAQGIWLPSLRRQRDDWAQLLESVGGLYVNGASLDWSAIHAPFAHQRVDLPTYPFQRQRYWFTDRPVSNVAQRRRPPSSLPTVNPLLGRRVRSALPTAQFENELSPVASNLLNDHRVYGMAVLPATAYIEMGLAASQAVLGEGPAVIEQLAINEALVVADGEARTSQVIVSARDSESAEFQVFSAEARDDAPWKLHATAVLRKATDLSTAADSAEPISDIQVRCSEQVAGESHRAELRSHGLAFGASLNGVQRIWRRDAEALARVALPDSESDEIEQYTCHPALLDACLQGLSAALGVDSATYLPVSLDRLVLCERPGPVVWSHVIVRPEEQRDMRVADVRVLGDDGRVLLVLTGLHLRRTQREALLRLIKLDDAEADCLYAVEWQAQDLPTDAATPSGHWLILADRGGIGRDLASHLEEQGCTCTLVEPTEPGALAALVADMPPLGGVVHLWGLQASDADMWLGCGSALELIQGLVKGNAHPRVWLATRGGQAVHASDSPDPIQALLWGLGRVVGQEEAELRCVCVDLDPGATIGAAGALYHEVCAGSDERQVALRAGGRYVARLVRGTLQAESESQPPRRLAVSRRGTLDDLVFEPDEPRVPAAGEVQIRVHASGLNFRDVLNVLGMYPGEAGPPGGECVGEIVQIGAGVSEFNVGDVVVGVGPGAFANFVTLPGDFVAHKPEALTDAQAATLPITFLTAQFALHHVAGLQSGQRVLIHAAAGGVGLAAVQVAMQAGAEVIATAGSPVKRDYVRSLGVQHVFDSRSLSFVEDVRRVTATKGVDVVLNSLSGEFVSASLSVLADGGRFVELGKRDLLTSSQVAALGRSIAYTPMDLADTARDDPKLLGRLLRAVMENANRGSLHPLPVRVFPFSEAQSAFRYMAQARHTGKVVLCVGSGAPVEIRSDATYLLTGAFGGIGRELVRWLVERGARSLALVSRAGPSRADAQALVEELESAGVRVLAACADVSSSDDLGRVLNEIGQTMPPLRGIIHAAGRLDDGILLHQNWTRFETVFAPKVAGAWNLHEQTAGRALDFFVLFSSIASVLGSAGQGNYAAANAYLGALANARRATGLPGLAIHWGAWAGAGMAVQPGLTERIEARGLHAFAPEEGVRRLEEAIHAGARGELTVASMDWPTYCGQSTADLPFLEALVSQAHDIGNTQHTHTMVRTSDQVLRARVADASAQNKYDIVLQCVVDCAGAVLGLGRDAIDPLLPLTDLGLTR